MQTLPALNIGTQALGSFAQGIAGLRAGNAQKKALYAQAIEEESAGNAQALLLRDKARATIGEQVAAQFSNGFAGGTGTALDSLVESQINAALDVMELRRQAEGRARAYRIKGDQAKVEGQYALAQGLIGAGSDISGGIQDWADARKGVTPRPVISS